MKKRLTRIAVGVLVGLLILIGVIWGLALVLGSHETSYAGQPLAHWRQQLESRDAGASNQAYITVNTQVIPQLVETMFHDTNDSSLRLAVIAQLNSLPLVHINFIEAVGRRAFAAFSLGQLGPPAKAAVPSLLQTLEGTDASVHEAAIYALGTIHSDPDVVIPILIPFLTNDDLNDDAATALGNFGSAAKVAVPNIIPLLFSKDNDARSAAKAALKKIDPAAAAKAGVR